MRSSQPTQPPGLIRALPWVALCAATLLTMPTEYEFAVALHWAPLVAWAYPVLLDAHAIGAYWSHRSADIATTIVLKLAVNIAAHLAAAGMIEMNPVVLSAGSGIVIIVGWRVHMLLIPRKPKKAKRKRRQRTAPAAPAAPVVVVPDSPEALDTLGPAEIEPAADERPGLPFGPTPKDMHQETYEEVMAAVVNDLKAPHSKVAAKTGHSPKTIQRARTGWRENLELGRATAPAAA